MSMFFIDHYNEVEKSESMHRHVERVVKKSRLPACFRKEFEEFGIKFTEEVRPGLEWALYDVNLPGGVTLVRPDSQMMQINVVKDGNPVFAFTLYDMTVDCILTWRKKTLVAMF